MYPHLWLADFMIQSSWSTVNHRTWEEILQYGCIHLPYSSKLTRVRFKLASKTSHGEKEIWGHDRGFYILEIENWAIF